MFGRKNNPYEDDPQDVVDSRLRQFYKREANKEFVEQRDALLHLKSVLTTDSGRKVFKFLLKSFEVGELPERGVEGSELHETVGFLRAGQSIFQLTSQANKKIAAELLAEIQGEKYERLIEITQLENG